MIIAMGSDLLGYELKEAVKGYLKGEGHVITDFGTLSIENPVDYVTAADDVAREVTAEKAERGIVICGSGVGVSIVANKHKGAYCVHAQNLWVTQNARQINNVNMLAVGAGMLGLRMTIDIVNAFLTTGFAPGASPERKAVLQGFLDNLKKVEEREFDSRNDESRKTN